jgi:hypothetical protein
LGASPGELPLPAILRGRSRPVEGINYLVNFLFANLIPIIVVVSIVLRIYSGMKSAAGSRRRKAVPTPVQEEGEDREPKFYLAEPAPPRPVPRQTAPPPSSLVPLPSPPAGAVSAVPRPGQPGAGTARTAPAVFFRRIGVLHPMQQALVLSEILGPPRALRRDP